MNEHEQREKKKLLFAARALWPGGIEVALISLMNSLDFSRYEISCLIAENDKTLADRLDPRIHLIVCDHADADYKYTLISELSRTSSNPSALRRSILWCAPMFKSIDARLYAKYVSSKLEPHYDVAIIYDIFVAELVVRSVSAEKYLMFYHHGAMGRAYHDEIGFKKSSNIIVVSDALCLQLQKKYPKYADKMLAIRNIIDVKGIIHKANSVQFSYNTESFNIVTCARLSYEKGIDLALLACRKLIDLGATNFHWYFIGDGREQSGLEMQMKELALEGHCTLLGRKENPYPFMKHADLFVLTSRAEANPLTPVEALALHIPVLATNTLGSAEVLDHGRNGMICSFEPDDIAHCIMRFMKDHALYHQYKEHSQLLDYEAENRKNLEALSRLF